LFVIPPIDEWVFRAEIAESGNLSIHDQVAGV